MGRTRSRRYVKRRIRRLGVASTIKRKFDDYVENELNWLRNTRPKAEADFITDTLPVGTVKDAVDDSLDTADKMETDWVKSMLHTKKRSRPKEIAVSDRNFRVRQSGKRTILRKKMSSSKGAHKFLFPAKNNKKMARGSLRKRVARLEAQHGGELKYKDFLGTLALTAADTPQSIDLTDISQGDNHDHRTGNSIKIRRIEMYIHLTSGEVVDVGLFRPNDTDDNFSGISVDNTKPGMLIDPQKGWKVNQWTIGGFNRDNFYGLVTTHSFPYGLKVDYSSTTGASVSKNKLLMTVIRNNGSSTTAEFSVRVWYAD